MKLGLGSCKDVSYVQLVRDESSPLGISVKDAKAGYWPVIKRIKPRSVAERSHSVCEGDVLLSVNGQNTLSMSRSQVRRLLKEVRSVCVNVKLEYELREASILHSAVYQRKTINLTLIKEDRTFGFTLRKRGTSYPMTVEFPVISHIKLGGPAHREGSMMVGDHLFRIDNVNLSWLSLREIACILQDAERAEFTIEYKVGVVNVPRREKNEIKLDIEVPDVDLGITMTFAPTHPPDITIASIRPGSLAERCGALSEGDVILAINDIKTSLLSAAKASHLVNSFKNQPGKLLYRSTRCRAERLNLGGQIPGTVKVSMISKVPLNSAVSAEENDNHDQQTLLSSSSNRSAVNYNTPVSEINDLNHCSQIETVGMFQTVTKNVSMLNNTLLQLCFLATKCKIAEKSSCLVGCDYCKMSHSSIRICDPCISDMNSVCTEAMNCIRSLALNYVDGSGGNDSHFLQLTDSVMNSNSVTETSAQFSRDLIQTFMDNFPKVLHEKTSLKDHLHTINEHLDWDCRGCNEKAMLVSLTIQKLLLMISLNDKNSQVETKINQFIDELSDMQVPCQDCLQSGCASANETFMISAKKYAESKHNSIADVDLTQVEVVTAAGTSEQKANVGLNLLRETAYFKPDEVPESVNSSSFAAFNKTYRFQEENLAVPSIKSNETLDSIHRNTKHHCKKIVEKLCDYKNLEPITRRCWRSVESFITSRRPVSFPSGLDRTESSAIVMPGCSKYCNNALRKTELNDSTSNQSNFYSEEGNVKSQSCSILHNNSANCSVTASTERSRESENRNVRSEIMEVTLTDDKKEGFGFVLGFQSPDSCIPLIMSIKPRSVAKRAGVLSIYDRVLAINGKSTVSLLPKELEAMQKRTALCKDIRLTVEFDVIVTEMRFGMFEVHLNRNLIIGFHYEDDFMRKGSPLRLRGVLKGSAAYRSGEIFAGDELLFLKCRKDENFNPVNFDYHRSDTITVTLRREWPQANRGVRGITEGHSSTTTDVPPTNIHPQGTLFRILGSSVRPMGDRTVMEFRVRLFKDPKTWDFGFLVGEKTDTGQAYVTDIRPGGPADESRVVKKLDRIIEVDGVMVGKNDFSVLSLLTRANDKVDLLLRRMCSR